MTNFIIYDLIFLAVFTLLIVLFLYTRRHNLKRQGILYLYKTRFGLKVIDSTAKRFEKILRPMQYFIIVCGYILMAVMIWMLARFTYIYFKFDIASQIKVPPLLPLFPYATDLFKVDFLPPFYFTYWIIVIAIIAITHEFAHGIFAKLNKIPVKSTGFGFLGPFLAAFVEPDEKKMQKAKKFPQLSILAAGTFANVIMTILFGTIMWVFFIYSFSPAGIMFNSYGTGVVNLGEITEVNGIPVQNILDIDEEIIVNNKTEFTTIKAAETTYLIPPENLINSINLNLTQIIAYEDAPAIKSGLKIGAPITKVDGVTIKNFDELGRIIKSYASGDKIMITTLEDKEEANHDVMLGEKNGQAYLGVGVYQVPQKGISGLFTKFLYSIKDPFVYYEPVWDGDFAWFIYNLLWWIVVINISVALVNMLPVGIFDGGRFFYLTVLGITGSDKIAKKTFAFTTWLILLIALLLMVRWAFAFF